MNSFRFSIPAVLLILLLLSFPSLPQTQLLKTGNAACYLFETPGDVLHITLGKVDISGVEYYKQKVGYLPWYDPSAGGIQYSRISGDSCYYIRNTISGSESLVFNFNWPVGKVIQSDTISNYVEEQRIDSIVIEDMFLPMDTVYYITGYSFDLANHDTTYWTIPYPYMRYSKKFGKIDFGINGIMQGVKVDGIRYGTVYPFPEEIYFSVDSLYSYTVTDTSKGYIINSSDYDIVVDTVSDKVAFMYYHTNFIRGSDSIKFSFVQRYPMSYPDTLNFLIPAHDSMLVRIDFIEAILGRLEFYFTDTLDFTLHFNGSGLEYSYSFMKSIQISGYAKVVGDAADEAAIPDRISLFQNYPNPFNPATEIKYGINKRSFVRLSVFDILGKEIAVLVNEEKLPGTYIKTFNALDLPSGVYFYKLTAGSFTETRKFLLLK